MFFVLVRVLLDVAILESEHGIPVMIETGLFLPLPFFGSPSTHLLRDSEEEDEEEEEDEDEDEDAPVFRRFEFGSWDIF